MVDINNKVSLSANTPDLYLNQAATAIQKRWRCRLRRRIQQDGSTFEQWRVEQVRKHFQDNLAEEVDLRSIRRNEPIELEKYYDTTEIRAMVGRCQEIKRLYKDTHYVFTHGQSLAYSLVNECIQHLEKRFHPERYHPLHAPFRIHEMVPKVQNSTEFFNIHDMNVLRDDDVNSEILSVDAYMWNGEGFESALHFLMHNSNISYCGIDIFKRVFARYLKDPGLVEVLARKAVDLAKLKKSYSTIGAYWAICIPKKSLENPKNSYAYRAHPFGKVCACHRKSKWQKVLEQLQNNEKIPCGLMSTPQYRILTSPMTKDRGVRTISFDALSNERRQYFEEKTKNLMRELIFYVDVMQAKDDKEQIRAIVAEAEKLRDMDQIFSFSYIKKLAPSHMQKALRCF